MSHKLSKKQPTVDRDTFYSLLGNVLDQELPGVGAQEKLAILPAKHFRKAPLSAKKAAVCALIYQKASQFRLAFIKRTHHVSDRHSGQISFPGGKIEETDPSVESAALRELEEETGIVLSSNHILGRLSKLYIPVSNFEVQPFVLGINYTPEIMKQDDEVAEIFGFSIEKLLQLPIQSKPMKVRGLSIPNAPYFNLDGKVLWGATAMMTNELLEVIRSTGYVNNN